LAIPKGVADLVVSWDHAIIYAEAWQLSQRVGYVPWAVGHREPRSLRRLWRKWFRWGVLEAVASSNPQYKEYRQMNMRKLRNRASVQGLFGDTEALKQLSLLLLKAVPYWTGFSSEKLRHGMSQ